MRISTQKSNLSIAKPLCHKSDRQTSAKKIGTAAVAKFMKLQRIHVRLFAIFLVQPSNRRFPQNGRAVSPRKEEANRLIFYQRPDLIDYRKNPDGFRSLGAREDLLPRECLHAHDPGYRKRIGPEIGPFQGEALGYPEAIIH